jgi:hypothetical protein
VYELDGGGWLCKRKAGGWVVLDADGQEAK